MEQTKELAMIAKNSGLEQTKTESLLKSFSESFSKAKNIAGTAREIVVTDEAQKDLMYNARRKRLELRQIRVNVENTRKELKEQSLREGKAIDGMANIIKALIVPVEEYLEKQEKFAEIREQARKAQRLADRTEKLAQYVEDVSLYQLNDMSDESFDKLLANSKKAYLDQKEAERKAEEERIAREKKEREEHEKTRQENVRLLKEREEREKKLQIEREKQAAVLKKAREEKEKALAKLRAEKEAQTQKELAEKQKQEAVEKAEKEAKLKALLAPDKEKLNKLAADLDSFKFPVVENQETGEILFEARKQLSRITNYLREKAKSL